jgi:hypothetical protein
MCPLAFPLHTGNPMTELVADRGWFETVTSIASGLLSITLLVLTVFVAPAAWQLWKAFKKVDRLLDHLEVNVGPLTRNASELAARIGELNALLAVFQQEAESTFVATASAVRGVRRGAATLTGGDADEELEDDDGDDDESDEDTYERERGRRLARRDEERRGGRPTRPRLRSHRPERG